MLMTPPRGKWAILARRSNLVHGTTSVINNIQGHLTCALRLPLALFRRIER